MSSSEWSLFPKHSLPSNVVNDGIKLEDTGSVKTQVKKIVKESHVSIKKINTLFLGGL